MKRSPNPAKESFLNNLPTISIDAHAHHFSDSLSFSLRYFESSQPAGQDFDAWSHPQLVKLLNKLKFYCANTVEHWKHERAGRLAILEVYNDFPRNSGFTHPKFVPVDVLWARFRLEQSVRLCGFLLPDDKVAQHGLRKNVFYIVFLDLNHKFYITEDS